MSYYNINNDIEANSILTKREIADALGVEPKQINHWMKIYCFHIPYFKRGGKVLFDYGEVLKWYNEYINPETGKLKTEVR